MMLLKLIGDWKFLTVITRGDECSLNTRHLLV